jgi:hypothetical protein
MGQGDKGKGSQQLFDLDSLKPLDGQLTGKGFEGAHIRRRFAASSDGSLFTSWIPGISPNGMASLIQKDNQWLSHYEHDSAGALIPGASGQFIYTSQGVYTPKWVNINPTKGTYIPALNSRFFLHIDQPATLAQKKADKETRITLHFEGEDRVLANVPGLDLPPNLYQAIVNDLPNDKRVFFIPDAKLIITITNDAQMGLHHFDVDHALATSGKKYLLVVSNPPSFVSRGTLYSYQLVVKSKNGGVTYSLAGAPPGMTISPTGLVTWQVPKNFALGQRNGLVLIRDKDGATSHALGINVR